jgi:hyperosmotically inducible periplasmic protein
MKHRILAITTIVAAALAVPMVTHAADAEGAKAKTKEYVKDSVITTKVKAELAAEKVSSLVKIQVDTDNAGVVTLSGSAPNQMAKDKAVSIAQAVKGVTSVDNQIKVVADK